MTLLPEREKSQKLIHELLDLLNETIDILEEAHPVLVRNDVKSTHQKSLEMFEKLEELK